VQYNKVGGKSYKQHWFKYIDCFRIQNFDQHPQEVKDAWFVFCEFMLVEVVKDWKNDVTRSNSLVSSVCSISDEVFAMVIGQTNLEKWIKKMFATKNTKSKSSIAAREGEQDVDAILDSNQDDRDSGGDDASQDQVEERPNDKIDKNKYYHLLKLHQILKQNLESYLSWDRGFYDHISISLATPPSKASSTKTMRSIEAHNDDEEATGAKEDSTVVFEPW
jgi:hypothetical protein